MIPPQRGEATRGRQDIAQGAAGAAPRVVLPNSGLAVWLRKTLQPGAVMFDVGANIGDYSEVAASLVGAAGHVYAVEPGPDNISRLRNRFSETANVTIIGAAASDGGAATTTLFLDRRYPTHHSLAARNVGKTGATVTVPQVALDDYCGELPRLDVVKIDAQGAELRILDGARQVIGRFKPRIVAELWPFGLRNFGATPGDLLNAFRALGYDVFRLSAEGLLKRDARHIEVVLGTTKRWKSIDVVGVLRTEPTWLQRYGRRFANRLAR